MVSWEVMCSRSCSYKMEGDSPNYIRLWQWLNHWNIGVHLLWKKALPILPNRTIHHVVLRIKRTMLFGNYPTLLKDKVIKSVYLYSFIFTWRAFCFEKTNVSQHKRVGSWGTFHWEHKESRTWFTFHARTIPVGDLANSHLTWLKVDLDKGEQVC